MGKAGESHSPGSQLGMQGTLWDEPVSKSTHYTTQRDHVGEATVQAAPPALCKATVQEDGTNPTAMEGNCSTGHRKKSLAVDPGRLL